MDKGFKAIVIGTGTIAQGCIKSLLENHFFVQVVEYSAKEVKTLDSFSKRNNLNYYFFNNKESISDFFIKIKENTLVVSASNRYLFTTEVINNLNLSIINYHSSLLPKHPGRNAEAWAIYEGDDKAGVTWHKVVEDVDAGSIIFQDEVEISTSTTSLMLLKVFNTLALNGFQKIIRDILNNDLKYIIQSDYDKTRIKYSWMKPNYGILNINWSEGQISRFLRSYDYGIFKNLGNFAVSHFDEGLKFYAYKIHSTPTFARKFTNSKIIEKENLIFEVQIDD